MKKVKNTFLAGYVWVIVIFILAVCLQYYSLPKMAIGGACFLILVLIFCMRKRELDNRAETWKQWWDAIDSELAINYSNFSGLIKRENEDALKLFTRVIFNSLQTRKILVIKHCLDFLEYLVNESKIGGDKGTWLLELTGEVRIWVAKQYLVSSESAFRGDIISNNDVVSQTLNEVLNIYHTDNVPTEIAKYWFSQYCVSTRTIPGANPTIDSGYAYILHDFFVELARIIDEEKVEVFPFADKYDKRKLSAALRLKKELFKYVQVNEYGPFRAELLELLLIDKAIITEEADRKWMSDCLQKKRAA